MEVRFNCVNNALINHSDVIVIMVTFNGGNKKGTFIAARNESIKMYKGRNRARRFAKNGFAV